MKVMRTIGRIGRGLLLWLVLASLVVIPSLLHPSRASATVPATSDTLDQSQTATWTGQSLFGSGAYFSQMAQVVTAGQSGFIDRVRVYIADGTASTPVTVSIETVSGGLPSGTVVGTGTIPISALPPPGSPQWVSIDISGAGALAMPAGTQYAVVLSVGGGVISWYTSGDSYSGGQMVEDLGGDWHSMASADALFQTYIFPDTLDQSQTSWNRNNLVSGGGWVGQVFTAGWSGVLDRVSVELSTYDPAIPVTSNITVNIYTLSGGRPTGTPIGSGTIPPSAIPPFGSPAWVEVGTGGVPVTAGTQYALVLSLSSGYVRWQDTNNGGSYPSGYELTWAGNMDGYDTAFKTYVVSPVLDQQQTEYVSQNIAFIGYPVAAAQIFTPGLSGTLYGVSVNLQYYFMEPTPINVTIQTLTDSSPRFPTGTVLGSGTIPASDIPGYDWPGQQAWVDVPITPALVTAGTRYAIVLTAADIYSGARTGWSEYPDDAYPAGYQLIDDPEHGGWLYEHMWTYDGYLRGDGQRDLTFKTYILPLRPLFQSGHGAPTTTALAFSVNPSVVKQQVTYTATVSPAPDGGTVLFQDNGKDIIGCTAQPIDPVSGSTTCSVPSTSVGEHIIAATYSGDNAYASSTTASTQYVQYAVRLLYKPPEKAKAGSTIPVKLELTDFLGQGISSAETRVQALCVAPTAGSSTDPCASAPSGFNWTSPPFTYLAARGPDGRYQLNIKTSGLDIGRTYQLFFHVAGEPPTFHAEAEATFTVAK